jgi:hypothetical protein
VGFMLGERRLLPKGVRGVVRTEEVAETAHPA